MCASCHHPVHPSGLTSLCYPNEDAAHARIQKILPEGSNFDKIFLVDEGKKDQNTNISRPSSNRQRMVFLWRADEGPTLNVGLVALLILRGSGPVLLRNPIFCDFRGVMTSCPPLDPPMLWSLLTYLAYGRYFDQTKYTARTICPQKLQCLL